MIAIEFLAKIERLLRDRFNRPNLVLADYFDYVAGTSTGAIIATLISLGYSIDDVHGFYRTGAHTMFDPNALQRVARRTKGPLAVLMGMIGMLIYRAMYTSLPLEREINKSSRIRRPTPKGRRRPSAPTNCRRC